MNLSHKPQRVLVTGGAGFIGSNFLLRMVPRYPDVSFINLDKLNYAGNLTNLIGIENHENYIFVKGDVADQQLIHDLFDHHRFTSVVHFAAESHVDRSIMAPLTFVESNTLGTVTLLEACRHTWKDNKKNHLFLHVSTDEVFGSLGHSSRFTESTPYNPRSPYSASKAAADHFVRAYSSTYNLPVIISNCSNNYGPYQFPEKLIPLVIMRATRNETIPIYGEGSNVRDWLHVTDHCDALNLILHRGTPGDTYLIGGNAESTNLNLVYLILDTVAQMTGRDTDSLRGLITFVKDRPGHDFRYAIDPRHIRRSLNWKPNFSLQSGIRQTVAWYLDNMDWIESLTNRSYQDYFQSQYGSI